MDILDDLLTLVETHLAKFQKDDQMRRKLSRRLEQIQQLFETSLGDEEEAEDEDEEEIQVLIDDFTEEAQLEIIDALEERGMALDELDSEQPIAKLVFLQGKKA